MAGTKLDACDISLFSYPRINVYQTIFFVVQRNRRKHTHALKLNTNGSNQIMFSYILMDHILNQILMDLI
ncbi:hypothetical protein HanIR_Chr01g0039131 [Helianthus annuus]|nr:hypothetical protein HanIR_Chr01g0039131 [Helianthus annuus]